MKNEERAKQEWERSLLIVRQEVCHRMYLAAEQQTVVQIKGNTIHSRGTQAEIDLSYKKYSEALEELRAFDKLHPWIE